MNKNINSITVLKEYFGFDTFREGQKEIIDSVLEGKDTVGIIPVGAGKTISYLVPALMLDGITLVITPITPKIKSFEKGLLSKNVPAFCIENASFCLLS